MALAVAVLALASCATTAATMTGATTEPAAGPPRYQADLTVLEGHGHGPQLCTAVAQSLPPQCGGPDVVGWDWSKVEHESQAGVRWGFYHVVGTWDGARLTLTEPPRPGERGGQETPEDDFRSPCPEPEGGWRPVDPAKATSGALEEALRRAATAPDYAGGWLDQSYLDQPGMDAEKDGNDPRRLVLNLRFTGDMPEREAWIRQVWGGALCVSGAERTLEELHEIQRRVEREEKGWTSIAADERKGHVALEVWVADDELRRRLDRTYGEGAVVAAGVLRPV